MPCSRVTAVARAGLAAGTELGTETGTGTSTVELNEDGLQSDLDVVVREVSESGSLARLDAVATSDETLSTGFEPSATETDPGCTGSAVGATTTLPTSTVLTSDSATGNETVVETTERARWGGVGFAGAASTALEDELHEELDVVLEEQHEDSRQHASPQP